jgi:hypothetical protein
MNRHVQYTSASEWAQTRRLISTFTLTRISTVSYYKNATSYKDMYINTNMDMHMDMDFINASISERM